ncbi:hypothetical protein F511_24167 [Dorcoceras hygrometricum]|uniref:Uncharacterized protein n=1 Tax=Dorcoceras hygrometricum TaxID=472368 RepID=A0A2Z7CEL6_9LAMI|nr:hypothetical protein F511_24167 [Dorcoceras hygrometricum]
MSFGLVKSNRWYLKFSDSKTMSFEEVDTTAFCLHAKDSADSYGYLESAGSVVELEKKTSSNDSAATQLQQLAFSDADFIFSTKIQIFSTRSKTLYPTRGNSQRLFTRTRQISRSNRRIERRQTSLKLRRPAGSRQTSWPYDICEKRDLTDISTNWLVISWEWSKAGASKQLEEQERTEQAQLQTKRGADAEVAPDDQFEDKNKEAGEEKERALQELMKQPA